MALEMMPGKGIGSFCPETGNQKSVFETLVFRSRVKPCDYGIWLFPKIPLPLPHQGSPRTAVQQGTDSVVMPGS